MSEQLFIEKDGQPVPCSKDELDTWLDENDPTVGLDFLGPDDSWSVHTAFYGRAVYVEAPVLCYLTYVWQGGNVVDEKAYATRAEADVGHAEMLTKWEKEWQESPH